MTLERCLDEAGKLGFWPMKKRRALRGPILDWLAESIPQGHDLNEKQVNEAINDRIKVMDHAYFRRMLVETGRLCRTPYGDRYWRPADRPEGSL